MEGKEYKLVEICDLITCGVAKRPEYFESGIPFLSSKNVKKNKIFFKDYNFISQEMHNELTKKNKPQRGDILYTRVGSFGEAAVIDFDDEFSVFVSLTLIKPKKKIVDAYYLMQFLNSEIVQALAKRSTIGNGVQNLNVNTVREFKIVLPSLSSQIQIANILSKAETLIEQRKQSIALLDEFLKSTFLEMFGDPVHNSKKWNLLLLSEFGESRLGKMLDGKKIIGNNLKPYLRNTNVLWFGFKLDELLEMDFDEKDKKEFSLEQGDILMCEGGEIGRCAIWKNELQECYFQKAIHRIKLNEKFALPKYFVFMFWQYTLNGGLKKFMNAATISHLTGEKLKKMKLPIPPIELQTQFAIIVTKTETLKEQYKNSLQELENLYGSLSQRAFKGELEFSKAVTAQ